MADLKDALNKKPTVGTELTMPGNEDDSKIISENYLGDGTDDGGKEPDWPKLVTDKKAEAGPAAEDRFKQVVTAVQPIGTVEASIQTGFDILLAKAKEAAAEGKESLEAFADKVKADGHLLVQSVLASTHLAMKGPQPKGAAPQAPVAPLDDVAKQIMDTTGMSAAEANQKVVPGANL